MSEQGSTFWDHLDVLRGVFFKIIVVISVLGVASFVLMPWIFDNVIMAPCRGDFPTYRLVESFSGMLDEELTSEFSVNIISEELTSQLFIQFSASCWLAIIMGFPIIIYLLWSFVAPGLYPHEKRGIKRAFLFGNLMFYLGVAVGYFLVFPLAVRFLANYRLSDTITPLVTLGSYMDTFFTLLLMLGAVFELPLLAWLLGKMGVLNKGFFKKYRRHAIVALLIVAGMITPTADPFTLFLVFIPIYALWEGSAYLVPSATEEV